jgi:hypothetical protein
MGSFFETIAHHWKGGGFGMYPIALCMVFAIAVIIDRIQVLFFAASVDKEQFLRGLKTHIFNGDLDKAISYTAGQKAKCRRPWTRLRCARCRGSRSAPATWR